MLRVGRWRCCRVLRQVAGVLRVGGWCCGVWLVRLGRVRPPAGVRTRLWLLVGRRGSILLRLLVLRWGGCIVLLLLHCIACKLRLLCRRGECSLLCILMALHLLPSMRWLLLLLLWMGWLACLLWRVLLLLLLLVVVGCLPCLL